MPKNTTNKKIDRVGGTQMLELFQQTAANKPIPLREIVEAMEDKAEALEYAIAAYENITGLIDQDRHALFDEFKLTSAQRIIFNFLYQRRGNTVSRNALIDCYHASLNNGSLPHEKIIDSFVLQIRRKTEGSRFRIETIWGIGYRMFEE